MRPRRRVFFPAPGCIDIHRQYNPPRNRGGYAPEVRTHMKDTIDPIENPVDDEAIADDADLEEIEPTEAELADATVPPDPAAGADVESIQDLLVKQEAREEEEAEDEDEPVVALSRDERAAEPLDSRIVPMQASEFVCKNCYLVKHRSQLADKKKMLCRDCA